MSPQNRILYCNCAYSQVIPKEVKEAVLKKLCESGVAFDAVADLCEMSARQDPALQRLTGSDGVKIAACFPRAVKWLCASAGAPLSENNTEILNMRSLSADEVIEALFNDELQPNVPPSRKSDPTESGAESGPEQSSPTETSNPSET